MHQISSPRNLYRQESKYFMHSNYIMFVRSSNLNGFTNKFKFKRRLLITYDVWSVADSLLKSIISVGESDRDNANLKNKEHALANRFKQLPTILVTDWTLSYVWST